MKKARTVYGAEYKEVISDALWLLLLWLVLAWSMITLDAVK